MVVVDPDDPDGQETDHVCGIARPLVGQGRQQSLPRFHVWHLDLQDEERDGDGHDPVGERFQPGRFGYPLNSLLPHVGEPTSKGPTSSL